MLFILSILLIILLIISYRTNKKELIAPSFVFVASFIFSIIWAIAFYNEWNLSTFSSKTLMVIFGGCAIFVLSSSFTKAFSNFFNKCDDTKHEVRNISVDTVFKVLTILFMIFSTFTILRSIVNTVGYSWENLFDAIERFDYLSKFSNLNIGISKVANTLRIVANALTYWYLYILINNIVSSKKIDILSLIIVLLGMLNSMAIGGRNSSINVIIAGVSILFMLLYKSKGHTLKLSKKAKVAIVLVPALVLITFPRLTSLVGREVSTTNTYYLAIYCGAEIKNLDMFLEDYSKEAYAGKNNMTFISLNNWLGPKLGYTEPYKFDLPFRRVNEYSLGNVYTTYYAYIYDYGYLGLVALVALMASILQFIYAKSKRTKLSNSPNIWILIYGYMFSSIVLAFFSNKFYEQNFNITFIYNIVLWLIFNKTILLLKIKKNK